MKLIKNKTVLGIACIVFALIICFLITPLYNRKLDGKKDIVVVAKDIKRGQMITDEMVKVLKVGSYNLSEQYLTSEAAVVGKYASDDLYKDEYLVSGRVREKPIANDEYLEGLDGSKGAISISVQSFAAGLSGKLFAGDVVSVISTDDKTTTILDELKYVKVLACTLDSGQDVDENTRSTGEDEENKDTVAATVTLLVNTEQAKLLANLEVNQKLHIELIYRGDEEKCNKFLKEQDKILKEAKEDTKNE